MGLEEMVAEERRLATCNGFVRDYDLDDEYKYDEKVARKAREFLRYWEERAHPGAQV